VFLKEPQTLAHVETVPEMVPLTMPTEVPPQNTVTALLTKRRCHMFLKMATRRNLHPQTTVILMLKSLHQRTVMILSRLLRTMTKTMAMMTMRGLLQHVENTLLLPITMTVMSIPKKKRRTKAIWLRILIRITAVWRTMIMMLTSTVMRMMVNSSVLMVGCETEVRSSSSAQQLKSRPLATHRVTSCNHFRD
jgi:hypothetical protein